MPVNKLAPGWRDSWSVAVLCPFHGPQEGAEYKAGLAPCGCMWIPREDDLLYAIERNGLRWAPVIVAVAERVPAGA